ncbi:MAG: enoyl-CoA hydratase/isomerase family protein [Thermodesulfobacteriota bacterium]
MASELLLVEREEGVVRLSLNIPDKMNALCPQLEGPIEDVRVALKEESVKVVVIRGEGGNFSTGSDIDLLGENMEPMYLCGVMKKMNSFVHELHEGPWTVITEVDGFAFGGGLGLALCSDITYATERAKFCTGFIKIGAVLDIGTSYFLTERIGMARAKEFALTGAVLGAEEALSIGLINKIVPHETISVEVMTLARKIARKSKDALAMTKRNLNRSLHIDLQTVLDLEAHIQPILLLSEEHKKAMKRFFPDK